MEADLDPREPTRELRLEGWTLLVAGVLLIAALLGAFQLGRAVERWGAPSRASATRPDPLANVEPQADDADEKLTFFDTLSGSGKEAEPKREAAKPATGASPTPPVAAGSGPWFVQVFVGRDRASAEEVVRTLRAQGYPVRTDATQEGGSGSLYKVRVGGFATRESAEAAVDRLHRDGQASTWVVKSGT